MPLPSINWRGLGQNNYILKSKLLLPQVKEPNEAAGADQTGPRPSEQMEVEEWFQMKLLMKHQNPVAFWSGTGGRHRRHKVLTSVSRWKNMAGKKTYVFIKQFSKTNYI